MSESDPEHIGLARLDPAAMEACYAEHLSDVLALLRHGFIYSTVKGTRHVFQVASAFDREELAQETFAQFFRACADGRFDPHRPVRPYLRRVLINLALRRYRKTGREVLEGTPTWEAVSVAPDPVEARQRTALVARFRASLDETERAVLDGCFAEGRSQTEVGDDVGLSRDQVYRVTVRVRRAALRFFRKAGWLDDA